MNDEILRIDKWLWAARFFKTRSLAAKAVEGGRVRLNGEGAKPSRALRPGDELAIRVGELEWVVEVKALSRQRGPAAQAALLYAEREVSRAATLTASRMRRAMTTLLSLGSNSTASWPAWTPSPTVTSSNSNVTFCVPSLTVKLWPSR